MKPRFGKAGAQALDRRDGPPHQQVGLLRYHHVRWRGKYVFAKKVACSLMVNEYKETNTSTSRVLNSSYKEAVSILKIIIQL